MSQVGKPTWLKLGKCELLYLIQWIKSKEVLYFFWFEPLDQIQWLTNAQLESSNGRGSSPYFDNNLQQKCDFVPTLFTDRIVMEYLPTDLWQKIFRQTSDKIVTLYLSEFPTEFQLIRIIDHRFSDRAFPPQTIENYFYRQISDRNSVAKALSCSSV